MTELLTSAQMRAIETAAIESGDVTGLELMERAGRGVVEAIFEEWPELAAPTPAAPAAGGSGGAAPSAPAAHSPPAFAGQDEAREWRAVVLCGPGNNGGDGFVVARLLAERGWAVDVFLYGDAEELPPDARVNHERWREIGTVRPWADEDIAELLDAGEFDLVVDGVFGTGLKRPMPEDTERTRHGFEPAGFAFCPRERRQKYVAIDLPSGLCSDSGRSLGGAFPAELTVTFHRPKIGHFLFPMTSSGGGANWCGKVRCVDIGLVGPGDAPKVALAKCSPNLSKGLGHKYTHGHALILSGGVGKGGAARLAARGALRVGAGAVTVGAPPAALIENAAQLNAVMLASVKDEEALTGILDDARINALCLGPGLGLDAREVSLLSTALQSGRSLCLDADALTLLSQRGELTAALHDKCVLTPHAGEFRRLFPDIAEKLEAPATTGPAYSKVDATREAAERAGCVVLFKGADTVIADPDGRCSINASFYDRSAPWLATAGSGDVLAGFITGLMARGLAPMQAAETGAWLHTECALSFGPGLIAEDLPEELPKVFRAMGVQ